MKNVITEGVKHALERSALCWLATVSANMVPNVSPKEMFTHVDDCIIIANIASPRSVQNINDHHKACLSFIDILVQKGFKIIGRESVIDGKDVRYLRYHKILDQMGGGLFPFKQIIVIQPEYVHPILAPRYLLYPDLTTEASQIASTKRQYRLDR